LSCFARAGVAAFVRNTAPSAGVKRLAAGEAGSYTGGPARRQLRRVDRFAVALNGVARRNSLSLASQFSPAHKSQA